MSTDPEQSPSDGTTGTLATALSDLARQLEHEDDPDAVLADIVRAATAMIPGAAEASVSTVTRGRRVDSHAASGDLPRRVDALQQETGQGPCLDALSEHRTVRVPDMASEDRWPDFAARAAALGAASMLAFQLYVEGDNLGALNLYAREPHGFGEDSEQIGLLVAAHAAIAHAGARKQEDLERAARAGSTVAGSAADQERGTPASGRVSVRS